MTSSSSNYWSADRSNSRVLWNLYPFELISNRSHVFETKSTYDIPCPMYMSFCCPPCIVFVYPPYVQSLLFHEGSHKWNFSSPFTNGEVRLLSPTIKSIHLTILQPKKILQQMQNNQMKIVINWNIFYIIKNNIFCILDIVGICQRTHNCPIS